MYKVINGKRYDTKTARFLGSWDNGLGRNDLNWFEEELYRTKTGNYFLHGIGGSMSPYSASDGDHICGGEYIKPFSEADARRWAEERLSGETYEIIFGVVEELSNDDDMEQIQALVSKETKNKMDLIKEKTGETNARLFTRLISRAYEESFKPE